MVRELAFLTCLALVALVVGCASESSSSNASGTVAAAPAGADADAVPGSAAASGGEARGASVTVVVRDQIGAPVVGRAVTSSDARGAVRRALTDEEGGVVLEDVVVPLDVAVEGAPTGDAAGVPTVLAGVEGERVDVELDEYDADALPPPQTLRVAVHVACDVPPCEAWASTASRHGRGERYVDDMAVGSHVVQLDVVHRWASAEALPRDRVAVHVLVGTGGRTSLAYATRDAGPPRPGELHDLGAVTASGVDASEVGMETDASALLGTWRSAASASVVLDDGATLALGPLPDRAVPVRVPRMPGARVAVEAWAERLATSPRETHATARTRGTFEVPAFAPLVVPLRPGPTPRVPTPGGKVSLRGPGLRWTLDGAPRHVRATVVDEARGRVLLRFRTTGTVLSFARLARLGLPRWPVGPAALELASSADVVAAACHGGDADATRGRFVARSWERVPFVVTP